MVLYDAYENMYAVKFAEKVENGALGLAREYLGGSLAELIDAPVPSTTFVELSSWTLSTDASIAFDDGSRPAPQVTVASTYLADAASPVTPMAFETVPSDDLAGVLVFNTWVSVGDRHWGNYIIQTTTNGPRLVSIDYATCLSGNGSAPTSVGDVGLLPFARTAGAAIDEYVHRLLAVTERRIRQAVGRVPGLWMSNGERERIVNFLLSGRLVTERLIADVFAA